LDHHPAGEPARGERRSACARGQGRCPAPVTNDHAVFEVLLPNEIRTSSTLH